MVSTWSPRADFRRPRKVARKWEADTRFPPAAVLLRCDVTGGWRHLSDSSSWWDAPTVRPATSVSGQNVRRAVWSSFSSMPADFEANKTPAAFTVVAFP